MQSLSLNKVYIAALAGIATCTLTSAATLTWNGGSSGTWDDVTENWLDNATPATWSDGNAVSFGTGTGTVSLSSAHNTTGLTLADGANWTFTGGTALAISDAVLRIGGTANNTNQVLNLGSLASFTYNASGNTFSIGGQFATNSGANNSSGTLTLSAGSNTITANVFGVANVGRNRSANASNIGTLNLGKTNTINANTITLGTNQAQGTMQFQAGLGPSTLTLRAADGISRVNIWNIGAGNSSNYSSSVGTLTMASDSILDASVDTLTIGDLGYGSQNGTGTLTMYAGTLDALTINLGVSRATAAAGTASGTLTVNGGTVLVQTLTLSSRTSTYGTANGTFNLNAGATLSATTIAAGTNASGTRAINWNDGTISNYTSTDLTIGSGITFTLAGASANHIFAIDDGQTGTINAVIAGTGPLTKTGNGILALNRANTFAGLAIVSEGTLIVNDAQALGTNDVIVESNGVLKLGDTAGVELTGVASLSVLGTLVFIDTNSKIALSGDYTLNSAVFDLNNLYNTEGTYQLFDVGGTGSGTVSFMNVDSGLNYSFDQGVLTVSLIPEPSAYALFGALGAAGLLVLRRRRK